MDPRFRQRPLTSLGRRLSVPFRRILQNRFVPFSRVRLVRLRGHPYKRISLPDSWRAERAARNLERFERFGIFPRLVAEVEHELLVEYVEGRTLPERVDARVAQRLARFFATLYGVEARREKTEETRFPGALERDLRFLHDAGVIDAERHAELGRLAERIAPSQVWMGWEYVDSLPKNFVATPDGRLVAIDVDALRADQLLGIGAAKTVVRFARPHRKVFFETLAKECPLPLDDSADYAELCFLADWIKLRFLKGRPRNDLRHFDDLLRRPPRARS